MHTQDTHPDFSGQEIFVALDTGNKSWKTCIMTKDLEHATFTQPPSTQVLINYLHRTFPGAHYRCVYEAGYQGFRPHDELRAHGVDCMVVNPADVPTTHKEQRRKSNRVDARKLCRSLRNGELTGIYVPSPSAVEDRALVRTRHRFVKKQTRCKNQIKALLATYGIVVPEELVHSHWSRNYLRWLEQLSFTRQSGSQAFQSYLAELLYLREIIAELTRHIRSLGLTAPYAASVADLRSYAGIGTLSAMSLLTELIDIHRFRSLDHLASYCGLVPDEHSTGEEQTLTGITHRRNPMLRGLLIECAWIAARKDPELLLAFNKLSARMPKNKVIIRIARKLLNRIRYVLLHCQEQPADGSENALAQD